MSLKFPSLNSAKTCFLSGHLGLEFTPLLLETSFFLHSQLRERFNSCESPRLNHVFKKKVWQVFSDAARGRQLLLATAYCVFSFRLKMEKATFIHLLLNLYKSADTNEKVASRGSNVFLKKD